MGQNLNTIKNPSVEALGDYWDSKEEQVQFLRLRDSAESNSCAKPKNIKVLLFMII